MGTELCDQCWKQRVIARVCIQDPGSHHPNGCFAGRSWGADGGHDPVPQLLIPLESSPQFSISPHLPSSPPPLLSALVCPFDSSTATSPLHPDIVILIPPPHCYFATRMPSSENTGAIANSRPVSPRAESLVSEDQLSSGQTTPQPSGLDRRLPGITHGFQQVRDNHSPSSSTSSSTPVPVMQRLKSVSTITDRICQLLGQSASSGSSSPAPNKNTPPTTPRATNSTGSSTLNGGSSGTPTAVSTPVLGPTTGKDSGRTTPVPVGPPKGKLIVEIQEARNIVPSECPYVVCTFESNEFISKGPKRDSYPIDGTRDSSADRDGGLGRSVAIPMKSRQSSNTSLPDAASAASGKSGASGITNPKWEHETVL